MSFERIPSTAGHADRRTLPRGPNGRVLCRRCSTECRSSRQTFCGPECVHAWKLTTQPRYQARFVFARDRGICAICGRDFGGLRAPRRWDVDHILPVSEGGGGCGIEGLRTLCRACHRAETAALRKRMIESKKGAS